MGDFFIQIHTLCFLHCLWELAYAFCFTDLGLDHVTLRTILSSKNFGNIKCCHSPYCTSAFDHENKTPSLVLVLE
jgi:hypothetical protein